MKKLFWSAQLPEYYTAVLNNEAMAVDSLVQDLDKFPDICYSCEMVLYRVFQCSSAASLL